MIRTLAFGNYRSLRDLRVPLGALTVVTGGNGTGKSNVYRGLRLLVDAAAGELGRALSREGGMPSALWAGNERVRTYKTKPTPRATEGTVRRETVRLTLGFADDDFAYELALGLPIPVPRTMFGHDPEVKHERVWSRDGSAKPTLLLERNGHSATVRDIDGKRVTYPAALDLGESVIAQIAEPHRYPEVLALRERIRRWRFYHQFRTDADSPLRQPQTGSRTTVLSHDGTDLAAALRTIIEIGDGDALQEKIAAAFDGAQLVIDGDDGRFSCALEMPGVLRPLRAAEWSDGMLRYVCLLAALLTPRPSPLLVLNEPEASLHPKLLEPLAHAIADAARESQVIVVSHAEPLLYALEARTVIEAIELKRDDGETRVVGQGILDVPSFP